MELDLRGRIALVTGAGQGVGRRIAHDLAQEGCAVCVNDLFEDRSARVADEIRAAGGQSMFFTADVADLSVIEQMFDAVRRRFGDVEILVNNAGIPPRLREPGAQRPLFVDDSPDVHAAMIALNLTGAMNTCQAALVAMRRARFGRIINIVSEAARVGEARLAAYSAAKAGVLGLTKALAREHGRDRVTVNCLALGAVAHEGIPEGPLSVLATPDTDATLAKMIRKYPAGEGLGRLGRPEDVSAAVAFLASARAEFITGQCIGVSGGFNMV